MEIKKETKWFCENARNLEQFSGQWVMFNAVEGLVENGSSLVKILKSAHKHKTSDHPYIFHVPSKEELDAPMSVIRRKTS